MIRLGLLLYLTLITAAGPGLCCCLASQVADVVARQPNPSEGCCPGHHPTKEKAPVPGKCPTAPCPCQETRFDPNLGRASDRSDILTELRQQVCFEFWCLPSTSVIVVSTNQSTLPGNMELTFLEGQDILRALHILRC